MHLDFMIKSPGRRHGPGEVHSKQPIARETKMRKCLCLILTGLSLIIPVSLSADQISNDILEYRTWITEMEGLERGPFSRLRWFCNDGTVLPPKSYACKDHGGGFQHGEWSEKTLKLREQGYFAISLVDQTVVKTVCSSLERQSDHCYH